MEKFKSLIIKYIKLSKLTKSQREVCDIQRRTRNATASDLCNAA